MNQVKYRRTNTVHFHLQEEPKVVNLTEMDGSMLVSWLEEGRVGSSCLMGTEVHFGKMKKVLEMDNGHGRTTRKDVIPLNGTK